VFITTIGGGFGCVFAAFIHKLTGGFNHEKVDYFIGNDLFGVDGGVGCGLQSVVE